MGIDVLVGVDEQVAETPQVSGSKSQLGKPRMYQVILHNDDYTPMDFVVEILVSIFDIGPEQALQLMWQVHTAGQAVCGLYVYDIAETKVHQVIQCARQHEHPLMCTMKAE